MATNVTATESCTIQMAPNIVAAGYRAKGEALGVMCMLMVAAMRANGKMIQPMDRGSITTRMDLTMKVVGKTTGSMDMEWKGMRMGLIMMVIISMGKSMVLENSYGLVKGSTRVSSIIIFSRGPRNIPMGQRK